MLLVELIWLMMMMGGDFGISVSGTIVSFPIITAWDLNDWITSNKIKHLIHANDVGNILDVSNYCSWFMSLKITTEFLKFKIKCINNVSISGSTMASHHIFSNYRSFDCCSHACLDDINLRRFFYFLEFCIIIQYAIVYLKTKFLISDLA